MPVVRATVLERFSATFSEVTTPRLLAAALLTSCTLLTGCAADSPPESAAPTSTAQAVEIAVPAPQVTLLAPGTGELRAVRYVDLGAHQTIPLRLGLGFTQTTGTSVDPQPQPGGDGIVLTATLSASVEQGPDADTSRVLTLEATDITRDDPALDVSPASGITSRVGLSGTGKVTTISFTPPAGVDAESQAEALGTVEGYLTALYGQLVVFPEDAIGVGAQWSVNSPLIGESNTLQTTTYTLISWDADTVVVSVEVSQRPAVTALPLGDGSDAQLAVTSTVSRGTGTIAIDLTQPLPVRMESALDTRVIYGAPPSTQVAQDTWQRTQI